MTNIAMLGAGFIGQMHSLSFGTVAKTLQGPNTPVRLVDLIETAAGRGLAEDVARRYGWENVVVDGWRTPATRDGVDLFINCGPNDAHVAPTIAAAEAGKHVFCEKPLAATAAEAHTLWRAAEAAGVKHMCAFVHRFIPALRVARDMIHGGDLGDILHFRSQFLLDMREPDGSLSWRFSKARAGGGATGDLGSHHIDVARFLVGEVVEVAASTRRWLGDADDDDVNDDAFSAVARLDQGALATFEASRVPAGHTLTGRIEVDGTKGTLRFSMERLNELVFNAPRQGPRIIAAATADQPYARFFLPVGIQGAHPAGWRDCFAYQAGHMLQALEDGRTVGPDGATFEDGYRVAEVVDAILRSAESRQFEAVTSRD